MKIIDENLSSHFECFQTVKGLEALSSCQDADLAILSTNVKDVKTDELLEKIKAAKDIPVMILTSNLTSRMRIHMLREGADDVMTKPFNPEELLLRLQNLVKRRQACL